MKYGLFTENPVTPPILKGATLIIFFHRPLSASFTDPQITDSADSHSVDSITSVKFLEHVGLGAQTCWKQIKQHFNTFL